MFCAAIRFTIIVIRVPANLCFENVVGDRFESSQRAMHINLFCKVTFILQGNCTKIGSNSKCPQGMEVLSNPHGEGKFN